MKEKICNQKKIVPGYTTLRIQTLFFGMYTNNYDDEPLYLDYVRVYSFIWSNVSTEAASRWLFYNCVGCSFIFLQRNALWWRTGWYQILHQILLSWLGGWAGRSNRKPGISRRRRRRAWSTRNPRRRRRRNSYSPRRSY